VHGSALFQRGETQALITIALGTGRDEQRVDGCSKSTRSGSSRYNFPSFSVGEVAANSAAPVDANRSRHARRTERQSGAAAHDDFPYTIRVISEHSRVKRSSSMASVCVQPWD